MLESQRGGPVLASSVQVCDAEWCLFVSAHPVFPLHPAEPKNVSDRVGRDWSHVLEMKIYF